jgi:hypothetical protein
MSHSQPGKSVRQFVNLLLEVEPKYRLDREVMNVSLRITMDAEAHVPDTLTRIRALTTVTVVGQKSKVSRPGVGGGQTVLDIYVKFLPISTELYKNLMVLGKNIKTLPGVRIVRVLALSGRPILHNDEPIVI